MAKISYIEKSFTVKTLATIEQANDIIEEYQADDLDLTLRQLYYQFVSRDFIPNKQSAYKRLGGIISDARMAGLIDWKAIEDRTRNIKGNTHWNNPGQIVRAAARGFQLDHWDNQQYKVEVWIEKEALVGVISSICNQLDVDYFACKGYVSQSEMWNAAQRMEEYKDRGQQPVIIHLGDHDPSGIDMTRDICDRHITFMGGVELERIALNMDQIEMYRPPSNPAKLTDSRCKGYIRKYGDKSWELDALNPRVLRDLIEGTVSHYRDNEAYEEIISKENEYLRVLKKVEDNWETL